MYKKYLSVSIMMLAPMCANAGGDYTAAIQQLDAEIARLQAQNQAGLEELQECEKKVKGFKISGITTLSLTGVGIGVNIGEAVKLNKLEKQSSALDASIAEKQAEIQRQKAEAATAGSENGSAAAQTQGEAGPQPQTVKGFLLSKVDVNSPDDTDCEYWEFDDTQSKNAQYVKKKGDWAAVFEYGVITGVAKCSETSGEMFNLGNPQDNTGLYCWCQMTQLQKQGETDFLPAESGWVVRYDNVEDSKCPSECAELCGGEVRVNEDLRRLLFDSINE
ncbi:MAG: hypothetical protein MJ164_02190 [Alphaproteobacteria bacterium]|nr:hypothetical protein [Alphaproteobacteria bacterium]